MIKGLFIKKEWDANLYPVNQNQTLLRGLAHVSTVKMAEKLNSNVVLKYDLYLNSKGIISVRGKSFCLLF